MSTDDLDAVLQVIGDLLDREPAERLVDEMRLDAHPYFCSWCGVWKTHSELGRWRYLSRVGEETPVNLCGDCNADLQSDERSSQLSPLVDQEPFPGLDVLCGPCVHRRGLRCKSPLARLNGGPGIRFEGMVQTVAVLLIRDHDNGGFRQERHEEWTPATSCDGRRVTRQ